MEKETNVNAGNAQGQNMLTERRSKFVYDAARLAAEAAMAPIIPVPWKEREEPFKAQFREVIERQCGDKRSTSPEELHGTWMEAYFAMGWVYGPVYSRENKVHPDLVPYWDLGQLERDKDAVFVALCEIARQWVYDSSVADASGIPNCPSSSSSANAQGTIELLRRIYQECQRGDGENGWIHNTQIISLVLPELANEFTAESERLKKEAWENLLVAPSLIKEQPAAQDLEEKEAVTRNTAVLQAALKDLLTKWTKRRATIRERYCVADYRDGLIDATGDCQRDLEAILSEADGQPEGATRVSSLAPWTWSELLPDLFAIRNGVGEIMGSTTSRKEAERICEEHNPPSPLLDSGEQKGKE